MLLVGCQAGYNKSLAAAVLYIYSADAWALIGAVSISMSELEKHSTIYSQQSDIHSIFFVPALRLPAGGPIIDLAEDRKSARGSNFSFQMMMIRNADVVGSKSHLLRIY